MFAHFKRSVNPTRTIRYKLSEGDYGELLAPKSTVAAVEGRYSLAALANSRETAALQPHNRPLALFLARHFDQRFTVEHPSWSGFDIRPPLAASAEANVKCKAPRALTPARGPLIPTFACELAGTGCECWSRTTSGRLCTRRSGARGFFRHQFGHGDEDRLTRGRDARLYAGHPRLCVEDGETWMAGASPAMTPEMKRPFTPRRPAARGA